MKIVFHGPSGELSDVLRRSVQQALASPVMDLAETAVARWKEAIADADLLIVDLNAGNAAAYLIGLSDALGKRTVLLSPISEFVPGIFADRSVIVHQWNLEHLRAELAKLATTDAAFEPAPIADDTPAGKFQQRFGDLLRAHGYVHRGPVEFDGTTFTLREQEMELPLVQAIAHRAKSLNLRVRML